MEAEKEVAEETKEEVMEEIEELKEEFGEDEVIENQDQQGERKGDGNPLETIIREEMYPGLSEDVIEKLPDEYKALVKMYYYDDMSQKDMAEKLGMTQMRISRKMKKAFSMLYKMIADNSTEV